MPNSKFFKKKPLPSPGVSVTGGSTAHGGYPTPPPPGATIPVGSPGQVFTSGSGQPTWQGVLTGSGNSQLGITAAQGIGMSVGQITGSLHTPNSHPYYQVNIDHTDGLFDAVFDVIKTWDVNVPGAYHGYMGCNGNHVQMILDAINLVKAQKAYNAAMRVVGS